MANMTEKPPNHIIKRWEGEQAPRIKVPEDWLKANNVKKYDYIKITFEKVKIVPEKKVEE